MDAWDKPCLRIGHGGAAGLAPANSMPSLKAALALGVDMVEFDIRPCRDALVLLHDDTLQIPGGLQTLASETSLAELQEKSDAAGQRIVTLEEALDLIRGKALINADLKVSGFEREVVEQFRARGMERETLYSSHFAESLQRIRGADPQARTGISYPEDKRNASGKPLLAPLVQFALLVMRLTLAQRVARMMTEAGTDSVMLYHKVLSPTTVRTIQKTGGRIFTWTVDKPGLMAKYKRMGVNGIASNRPDLFKEARIL